MGLLFRKIRQKLLYGNRMGKYLSYAIGEIFLVMVGILLALQVNNWNEDRNQQRVEKEIISGIRNDLAQDKDYIALIISLAQKKDSVYAILSQHLESLYTANRPRLDSLINLYFVSQRTFYPISGSFQAAIAGNEIAKFKNKDFSEAATKLYNSTYTRLMDNAKDTDNRWHYTTHKYSEIRRTGHFPDMSPEERREFLNEIYHHNYGLKHYTNNLTTTIREIDMILTNNP